MIPNPTTCSLYRLLLLVILVLPVLAEDDPHPRIQAWAEQAPSARYPEVREVIFSESVPQWSPPTHKIAFDQSARHVVPPNLASHYPFPHGITFRCRLPYPSAVSVAYHEKQAPEEELWSLPELPFGKERSTDLHKEGYHMLQWLKMEANPNGIVMGEALVTVVPPEAWRGRSRPGEHGSEGVEFLLRNVSINPRYYDKKYKGPGQTRSSAYSFTVRAGT